MNDLELKTFIKNNRCNFTRLLRVHYKNLYEEIDTKYTGEKFTEKLYRYLHRTDDTTGKCIVCKSDCQFMHFNKGFRETCNIKCRDVLRMINARAIRNCKICNTEFEVYKKTKNQFCSDKCRLIQNKLNSKDRTSKSYKSNLLNHGGMYSTTLSDHVLKSKATTLKKYGDENYRNVEKAKHTKLQKYGSETYNNIDKVKKTCLEKYGVHNIFLYKKSNGIGISKPQQRLYNLIKEKYPNAVLEYYIPELKISADIYIPDKNLIVEFFGDYWHCNPVKYSGDYYHRYIHLSASEIWKKDKIREDNIKKLGYEFKIIWESDFSKHSSLDI
jgi:hypothetical protein